MPFNNSRDSIIVVVVVGALIAVAVPAYQDYAASVYVSRELLPESAQVAAAVGEYWQRNKAYPDRPQGAAPAGAIKAVSINPRSGEIVVTVESGKHSQLDGMALTFTPQVGPGNQLSWKCRVADSRWKKYVPEHCR